jgi:hypothetical protein
MKESVVACYEVLFHPTLILTNEIHEQCLQAHTGSWQKFEYGVSVISNATPSTYPAILGLESCCCVLES